MAKYIIGIDAGTSMIKSVLFDEKGNELGIASKPVEMLMPAPGHMEQDMNAVWDSVVSVVKETLDKTGADKSEVEAIAITAQADGLWLVDYEGNPVTNAMSWTDGRALDICIRWYMDGTDQKIYSTVGSTFYPGSYICLIKWLQENNPQLLEKAQWFATCKDWVKFKFTGDMSGDDSFAVTANIAKREIDDAMLDVYGFRDVASKIPPMKVAQENHAPLKKEVADSLGLKAGIPVFGGPIDVVACAIGAGVHNEGDACAIVGTTTMVDFAQDTSESDPQGIGFTLMGSFPGKWVRAFGIMAGTPNLEWAIANIGHKYIYEAEKKGTSVYDEIEEHIKDLPPGAGGVMYHPYITFAGERAPFVKPSAKAQFFGISQEHTTDNLMCAVYEGVGFSIVDCIEHCLVKPDHLRVIGGGAKSRFWCQMFADMTGLDVIVPQGEEFGAKGASIVASVALGLFPSAEDAIEKTVHTKEVFTPNPEKTAVYQKLYGLYKSIYGHLWDDWDLRAGILQGQI